MFGSADWVDEQADIITVADSNAANMDQRCILTPAVRQRDSNSKRGFRHVLGATVSATSPLLALVQSQGANEPLDFVANRRRDIDEYDAVVEFAKLLRRMHDFSTQLQRAPRLAVR